VAKRLSRQPLGGKKKGNVSMKYLLILPIFVLICSCTGKISATSPSTSSNLVDGILPPLSPKEGWKYLGIVDEAITIHNSINTYKLSGGLFESNQITNDNYYSKQNMQGKGWFVVGAAMRGGLSETIYYNWEIDRYLIIMNVNDTNKYLSYHDLWMSLIHKNIPTPEKNSSILGLYYLQPGITAQHAAAADLAKARRENVELRF
jgi:hypothetical protein